MSGKANKYKVFKLKKSEYENNLKEFDDNI